jgi:hypothetical protein
MVIGLIVGIATVLLSKRQLRWAGAVGFGVGAGG